jgi:hypothetical protein
MGYNVSTLVTTGDIFVTVVEVFALLESCTSTVGSLFLSSTFRESVSLTFKNHDAQEGWTP